jgi:hypothetical protein
MIKIKTSDIFHVLLNVLLIFVNILWVDGVLSIIVVILSSLAIVFLLIEIYVIRPRKDR